MKTYRSDQFTDSGVYLFRQRNGNRDAPHKHNFTELVYIAEGVCTQSVDGVSFRAHAGDVILIEEGMTHAFDSIVGQDFAYVNVILTREFLDKYACDALFCHPEGAQGRHAVSLGTRARRLFEDLLDEMTHELLNGGYAAHSAVGGMVRTLLSLFYRALHEKRSESAEGGCFAALLTEIEGRLTEHITLASLAASVGYDQEYFCRAFKRHVGKSPMAYVTERRVLRAAALLSGTDLSVSEIGARCGFYDRSVMARAFRRVLGKSPSSIRTAGANDVALSHK